MQTHCPPLRRLAEAGEAVASKEGQVLPRVAQEARVREGSLETDRSLACWRTVH